MKHALKVLYLTALLTVTILLAVVDTKASANSQGNSLNEIRLAEANEEMLAGDTQVDEDMAWFKKRRPDVGRLMKSERKHKIGSTMLLEVTAYTAADDENGGFGDMAASNKRVRPGTVAVSRDLFKQGWRFGKKIHIQGMGTYVINDLMSQRQRRKIDVFLTDKGKAIQFGVKQKKITLLTE